MPDLPELLVQVDSIWLLSILVARCWYGMVWREMAQIADAGVPSIRADGLPRLATVAGYVSPELQLQVQLCQQSHHSTLHSREAVTAHEYALTFYIETAMCHAPLCTALAPAQEPHLPRDPRHGCEDSALLWQPHEHGSGLALSSVAAHGDMDTCCRRLAVFDFLAPACASRSAPSLPVTSKHSSRVSVSGSVTVSLRMRE